MSCFENGCRKPPLYLYRGTPEIHRNRVVYHVLSDIALARVGWFIEALFITIYGRIQLNFATDTFICDADKIADLLGVYLQTENKYSK